MTTTTESWNVWWNAFSIFDTEYVISATKTKAEKDIFEIICNLNVRCWANCIRSQTLPMEPCRVVWWRKCRSSHVPETLKPWTRHRNSDSVEIASYFSTSYAIHVFRFRATSHRQRHSLVCVCVWVVGRTTNSLKNFATKTTLFLISHFVCVVANSRK